MNSNIEGLAKPEGFHLYSGYVIETVRHISLLATSSGIVKVMVDEHIASEHDGSDREEKTNIVFEISVNAKLTEIAALNRRSARASHTAGNGASPRVKMRVAHFDH